MVLEIAATLSKCGRNVAGNDQNLLGCFYIMLKNSVMKALFCYYFTKLIKIIKKVVVFLAHTIYICENIFKFK